MSGSLVKVIRKLSPNDGELLGSKNKLLYLIENGYFLRVYTVQVGEEVFYKVSPVCQILSPASVKFKLSKFSHPGFV